MNSLMNLCILTIGRAGDVETLNIVREIDPTFEVRVFKVLSINTQLKLMNESKEWYNSGHLRKHILREGSVTHHVELFKNGSIYKKYSKHQGVSFGEYCEYYYNGKQRELINFINGKPREIKTWQINGTISRDKCIINDTDFIEKKYYKTGKLGSTVIHISGIVNSEYCEPDMSKNELSSVYASNGII